MATEVNQTFFAWSQGETTERDGSQAVSVSQTLDHGSISFGRFELESLSWEKWSVFTNDRRHEEFGKFNGLVAEKKAYFEEYYKKIRELKASQQRNQQTELTLEYSGDGSDSSQTADDEPAEDLETPTGVVDDYVEQATHETTSEQGLQCYDGRENENFNAEFSLSSHSSSGGVLQQTDQVIRENVCGDNSDSANRMDIMQKNSSPGHDGLQTAYGTVKAPKRITDKDSRLRYASKIIPKSVKMLSDNLPDHTSVNKKPTSVKTSMIMNQKNKPNNTRPLQRPNAAPQKMAAAAKETLGLTGLRRPSSASAQRPSSRERHPIARESVKKHATDVCTPHRPSTSERHPVTREHGQRRADATPPHRPSTSERRLVNRESAVEHADIANIRWPSTGERRFVTRDSVLKVDPRTPSKTKATMAHPKGASTTGSSQKMEVIPNASKTSKLETIRNVKGPKGPSKLDSHSTRSKRMDLQVAGKQKSSSVNLPPQKKFSSSIGEPLTFARPKMKEGVQVTTQSRASASKKTVPSQTGNVKARTPNPPAPPPPPGRPSRTMNKPNTSSTSIGGRKLSRPSAPQWH